MPVVEKDCTTHHICDCQRTELERLRARDDAVFHATSELVRVYLDVLKQHEKEPGAYWQGKKDGLRTALALLEPGDSWTTINESSYGKRLTDLEKLSRLVEDAAHYIGEVLWAHEAGDDVMPLSWVNMRNWYRAVKALEGNLLPELSTCYD
jgi:hypothetical protein